MDTIEQLPTLTHEEIADKIKQVLDANEVKLGTKRAKTIEYSFLQGMMVADNRYAQNAYLVILLVSGRSIFDKQS